MHIDRHALIHRAEDRCGCMQAEYENYEEKAVGKANGKAHSIIPRRRGDMLQNIPRAHRTQGFLSASVVRQADQP